jgi:hypothetical protein
MSAKLTISTFRVYKLILRCEVFQVLKLKQDETMQHPEETAMVNDGQSTMTIDVAAGDDRDLPAGTKHYLSPEEGSTKCDESSSYSDGAAVETRTKTVVVTSSDWSDALKSPNDVFLFSPSLDPSKSESLHGLGKNKKLVCFMG